MGEGVFLAVNQILNCIFQILDFAQQPKGQLRQPKGAYEKRDHQQDKAVMRGVCHQDGHAQQGNHRTEQPQHQAGHIWEYCPLSVSRYRQMQKRTCKATNFAVQVRLFHCIYGISVQYVSRIAPLWGKWFF